MPKRTLSAQVSTDSELYEEFEKYEEQFESRSEAMRDVLKRGIPNYAHGETEESRPYTDRVLSRVSRNVDYYAAFGIIGALLTFVASDLAVVAASFALAVIGVTAALAGFGVRVLNFLDRRPTVPAAGEVAEDA